MAEIEVSATIEALDALLERMRDATRKAVEQSAMVLVAQAQRNAPRKTGTLARSIYADPVEQKSATTWATRVAPHTKYGRIRELGGTILPKRARMLSWLGPDGRRVFAHQVTQTGTFYLSRAVAQSGPKIRDVCESNWARAIRG